MNLQKFAIAAISCLPLAALADEPATAPAPQHLLDWGVRIAGLSLPGSPETSAVVHSELVSVPGALWLKISFAGTTLGGDPASEGARLRITSLRDGAVQLLSGESLALAGDSSVYFNGDACLVELIASGGIAPSVLSIAQITVGDEPDPWSRRTICGTTDDRALSTDPRNARMLSIGCTAWLINDTNHQFLTAGHCTPSAGSVMQFNVPLSTVTGGLINPGPQDQYPIDVASSQLTNGGIGNDWQYLGAVANSTTGLTAYQAQHSAYNTAAAPAAAAGDLIRITGYGIVAAPVSLTRNQVQQTHVGGYFQLSGLNVRYTTDTTGGNSGSPVVLESTGVAIGIHTHAGCTSSGGYNNGTAFQIPGLQAALAAPRSICKTGAGVPSGNLFVIGDGANNFGTASTSTGSFARISSPGVFYQGLAYNPVTDDFFAINSARLLQRIDPATGAPTDLGIVQGTSLTFNSLAYNPVNNMLYSITASTGQLWAINAVSLTASPIGPALPRPVAGAEFDPIAGVLYAVEDAATGSRLITIDTATGLSTIIGNLGAGILDCNGLAVDPATSTLYTIDATTDNLLRINAATGVATIIGPSGGVFASQYGLAYRYSYTPCAADFNLDGALDFSDYLDFVAAFSAADATSDFNRDSIIDLFDYLDFVAVFSNGC